LRSVLLLWVLLLWVLWRWILLGWILLKIAQLFQQLLWSLDLRLLLRLQRLLRLLRTV